MNNIKNITIGEPGAFRDRFFVTAERDGQQYQIEIWTSSLAGAQLLLDIYGYKLSSIR